MKPRLSTLLLSLPILAVGASTALADDWGFNVSFGSRRHYAPAYYPAPVAYRSCYSDVFVEPVYYPPVVRYYDAAPVYYERSYSRRYYGHDYYRPSRYCGSRYSSGHVRVYRR